MELFRLIDFSSLNDEEKKTLYVFLTLMNATNYKDSYMFKEYKKLGFGIYKKDGIWQACIDEYGQPCLFKRYDSVYDACKDIFNSLLFNSKEQYLEMFHKLMEEDICTKTIDDYFDNFTKESNEKEDKQL